MKFKETSRSEVLYISLTQERDIELQRVRNHGEGTKEYPWELTEDQGYFISVSGKSCLYQLLSVSGERSGVLHPDTGGTSSQRETMHFFWVEKEMAEDSSSVCCFAHIFSSK